MAKRRKRLSLTVEITVPINMNFAEAKREVRALINYQSGFSQKWEDGAVKAVRVSNITKRKAP